MSTSESQEPLQERLKDQVSVSIKEALDKANTVLTNLHRVQSYLDVIRILSTHRSSDVIKNALEQIHAARNDTATLLQHIYLTEIGLQSLQDYGNGGGLIGLPSGSTAGSATNPSSSSGGGVAGGSGLGSLMPILGAAGINSSAAAVATAVAVIDGVHDSVMEGLGAQELDFTTATAAGGGGGGGEAGGVEEDDGQPPTKKMKPGGGVTVSTCVSCSRKFAAPYSATNTHLCRTCRSSVATSMVAATSSPQATSSSSVPLKAANSSQKLLLTSTPKVTKLGGGGGSGGKQGSVGGGGSGSVGIGSGRNLVPMRCKICNTSFRYRRCLFRHLRENHPGIDQDNLMQYIDMAPALTTDATSLSMKGDVSLTGSKGGGRQQQDGNISASSSLHVTIGSEVSGGDLSEVAAASMLTGEGEGANENGVLLSSDGRLEAPHSEPSSDDDDDDDEEEGELNADGDPQALSAATPDDKGTSTPGKLPGKYNCTVCSKSFDRPYRLQRHLQIHNPNRPRVQCQFCDRSFTRIDTLENHIKSLHSNERPFKCSFEGCEKSFPLNSALVHHLKTHMGGKPYQCGECDLSFALFGEFKGHVNDAHAFTKDRRCTDCFKVFSTAEQQEQHFALEHRYECEICGKSFARLGYLQAHIEIHNGVSMFNCRQCDAGFNSEYSYKQHIKTHPNYNKAKRVYPCHVCGKTFYESRKMIQHSHTDEHQEKAKSLGLPAGVVLQNLSESEDVPPTDMSVLVNEVANSIQASGTTATPSVDDNLIQSIVESEAFKAAAASVGVSTSAATATTAVGTSMNTSSNSGSEGSSGSSSSVGSSLLNSGGGGGGGGVVNETAATLLQTPVVSVTIASIEQ